MNGTSTTSAGQAGAATTTAGLYHGIARDGVSVFRGIRYAQAPIGNDRFAPPRPVAAPQGPVDATGYGPISIQDVDPLPMVLPGTEHNYYAANAVASEDCLNLNIWTSDTSGRAPVIVWIHGGAFLCGSGTGAWLDGTRLARDNGVVVVTLNYRLGYLGGLYLGDYDERRSNLALQDMLEALRWIQKNIATFGGDPDRVTIGGQSAGAIAGAALIAAPKGRGLFRRAIIDSGHADAFIGLDAARDTTSYLLDRLSVDPRGDVLEQLRAVSTFRICSIQRELGISRRAFPVVMDGITLPADPLAAIAERTDVDILIGTTSEEDRLFEITGWAPPARTLAQTVAGFLSEAAARDEAETLYAPMLERLANDNGLLTHLIATEHSWGEPARQLATSHSAAGGLSYHYEFAWASSAVDGRVGAAHLVDLPFFFDNLHQPGVIELLGDAGNSESARALARGLSAAIASFARSGDPGGPLGAWPAFTPAKRATMVLDSTSHVEVDRLAARLDFWTRQRGKSIPALSSIGGGE